MKFLCHLLAALLLLAPTPAYATIANEGNFVTANSTVSGATLTSGAVTATIAIGNIAILAIGMNNTGTTDADHSEVTSVTDSSSNTWVKVCEFTNGQGGAAAGVTVSVWMAKVTTQITNAVSTVTANFANTITARSFIGREYTVDSGNSLKLARSCQTEAVDGADIGSLATGALPSAQYLFFRAFVQENDEATNTTPTANYAISAEVIADGGVDTDSIRTEVEWDLEAASTGSTSNPTTADTDNDGVSVLLTFVECVLPCSGAASKRNVIVVD